MNPPYHILNCPECNTQLEKDRQFDINDEIEVKCFKCGIILIIRAKIELEYLKKYTTTK